MAFTASRSSAFTSGIGKIIFNNVLTNEGGAYSGSTGIFTCPSDGAYVFTWSFLTSYKNSCHVFLSKNGTIQTTLDGHVNLQGLSSYTVYTPATMSGTFRLSKGEMVWIHANRCGSFLGSPYNAFSGWKL